MFTGKVASSVVTYSYPDFTPQLFTVGDAWKKVLPSHKVMTHNSILLQTITARASGFNTSLALTRRVERSVSAQGENATVNIYGCVYKIKTWWRKQVVVVVRDILYIHNRSCTHRPLNVNQRGGASYSGSRGHSGSGCNSEHRSSAGRHHLTNSKHAARKATYQKVLHLRIHIPSVNNRSKISSYAARNQPDHRQSYHTSSNLRSQTQRATRQPQGCEQQLNKYNPN